MKIMKKPRTENYVNTVHDYLESLLAHDGNPVNLSVYGLDEIVSPLSETPQQQ
jgi:hypothetical protein